VVYSQFQARALSCKLPPFLAVFASRGDAIGAKPPSGQEWASLPPPHKEPGERRPTGPSTPVPERVIVFTLPVAESVKVSSPVRVPATVGVKVTATAQSLPSARPEPQVFFEAKSPLVAMFAIVSGPLPRSPTATVSGGLVTPRP
jgi:hypothetical protein